jgi:iron complex outermembrane receptor protein
MAPKCSIKLVILFLLAVFQIKAQSIYGTVKSRKGEPIPYASIIALNSSIEVVSDSLGNFKILLDQGSYNLYASALGFSSQLKLITLNQQDLVIHFELELNIKSLNEIVVSADKMEKTAFDSPMALTVITNQKLQDTRTWKLEDLRGMIPNYQYADLGVSYQQLQSIRGISVFSENPAVATYIDGVNALDVSSNGIQLIDVERIEVLRGPQGTLYGRNAMGGVINIVTKQPTNISNRFFEISTGNQGLQRYALGIKSPIIKHKLFVGFTVQYQKLYGFYVNDLSNKTSFDGASLKGTPEDGKRMGDEESYYLNFFLKWLINQQWKLTINGKIQRDQSIGASMYYQAVEDEITAVKQPYKMAVNALGSHQRSLLNTSIILNNFHAKYTFSSISSAQFIEQAYSHIDQDLYTYAIAQGFTYNNKIGDAMPQRVISQEFRLNSPAKAKQLTWVLGTYFFSQNNKKSYAAQYEKLALLLGQTPGIQVTQAHDLNNGAAAFGQATYHYRTSFEFTLGLRYDFEDRSTTLAKFNVDSLNQRTYVLNDVSRSKNFQALTPKLQLSYKLKRNHHLYTSFTKGYRAGGINPSVNANGYESYKPEFSDHVEIGHKFKSENGKYTLQTAFFYLFWTNLQLDYRTDAGFYIINNIGQVIAKGIEFEGTAIPVKNLECDLNIGINHSRYQDFEFLGKNIKDNKTILAPPITGFTSIQYHFVCNKNTKITPRFETRYMGEQYFDLINTIKQPAYFLFNSRFTLLYKSLSLSLWVQNINDKQYISYALPGYFRYTLLNRPRSFGITLSTQF